MTALSDSLKVNTSLTMLNLNRMYEKINNTNRTSKFFTYQFKHNGTDIGIRGGGVKSLSEVLKTNSTLTALSLSREDKRKKTYNLHPSEIHVFSIIVA